MRRLVVMYRYVLTIYWWNGDERSSGGEDRFEAANDAEAVTLALSLFEEAIALADQCEITDERGAVVWTSEWPRS
jgi:hypothetical protein